jgi:hypothetical protein
MVYFLKREEEAQMEDKKQTSVPEEQQGPKTPEWATEALEEMDEFIESQGIYIRQ